MLVELGQEMEGGPCRPCFAIRIAFYMRVTAALWGPFLGNVSSSQKHVTKDSSPREGGGDEEKMQAENEGMTKTSTMSPGTRCWQQDQW